MSGHTPGPWSVHQRPTDPREYGYHVIAEGGLTVCSVSYQLPCNVGGRFGEHTREANARLIAAAPDLLEALMLARDIIGHPDDEASRVISAAIAKATGETT